MNALSLFSGIGGIDLACEWAGIKTVAFCEREPFPQKVLKKHWPHVPIYDDVCTLTKERLDQDGIGTIDLIHGGTPCQPFSINGKRQDVDDERNLWPEMYRLIREIQPAWVIVENVENFLRMEQYHRTICDLEKGKYETRTFVFPACAVGAEHKRERVFVVANHQSIGMERMWPTWKQVTSALDSSLLSVRDCNGQWKIEPDICRTVNGIPNRVDRLKSLGNAVVPQQIYPIIAAIKQIDDLITASRETTTV